MTSLVIKLVIVADGPCNQLSDLKSISHINITSFSHEYSLYNPFTVCLLIL